MANLRGWPRETDMDLERGDAQVMRAKEDRALAGYDPWFHRKRCETGDGDPQNMECMVCGAAFGEVCRHGD